MATLLSAPTLSASQFAEFIEPAPLYQCPRSATPTMSRPRLTRDSSCSLYPSPSFGTELYRAPTRDCRDRRRDSTPPSPSAKRWSISLVRPRLRRSESDEPPRRSSRSKSPKRAKSTKSARSSETRPDSTEHRYSVFSAFGGFGAPLKKVENHTALVEARLDAPSPQPLPCLEACTGPPSPAVETFSSTATTLFDEPERDPFFDDDGIIWVVPRSRRGSRASSYSPAKPKCVMQHSTPEPQSMADLKRDSYGLHDVLNVHEVQPVPSKNRVRIERISNWGLPSSPREDKVWSKLSVTWWRRKST
ncbi:hypothetical protein A1Q2_01574 [Trichosporon asahii var. asahii CBS 8904]|uniref:Uncharacterized protein n=1 Tax=Trichosporon asahii var. asahii (strain CBS 8904) TaxID=1220162 RepID=K1WT40_TRIAC|nr:hypothetical protein A1Q2_01574 [Trichosporon asahii var. asahii CBS 8904]